MRLVLLLKFFYFYFYKLETICLQVVTKDCQRKMFVDMVSKKADRTQNLFGIQRQAHPTLSCTVCNYLHVGSQKKGMQSCECVFILKSLRSKTIQQAFFIPGIWE